MIEALLSAKIAMVGIWFVALAAAERLQPAAPRSPRSDRTRLPRNLGLWFANVLINPLIIVPISAAATSADLWTRPDLGFWGLALDFLLLDLWVYFWHRANHEWSFLWRFHRVHHLDQFLDTTSAVRFHAGEVLISAVARAPLIMLADIPLIVVALFDVLILLAALFHHANVRLPTRFEAALRVLIVTPSHHLVHHHAVAADTNSNYATVLTLWDRVFRSWSPSERQSSMLIGVKDAGDEPLLSLAVSPLRRN